MTTLTTFELVCALLSSYAYQEGRKPENLTPPPGGAIQLPGSLGHTVDIASGFESTAVRYGEKVVITFAGTDPATIFDIQADAYLGLGIMHRQLQLAAKFYKDVQAQQQPGQEIVIAFTGTNEPSDWSDAHLCIAGFGQDVIQGGDGADLLAGGFCIDSDDLVDGDFARQRINADGQQIVPSSAAANDPEWTGPTQRVHRTAGGAA